MIDKIKGLLKQLQDKGLPIIILRDNLTGKPSITYSFFVLSGVLVVSGLIRSMDKITGGVDMDNALPFFYACSATYLGRKLTNQNNKSTTEVDKE